MLKKLLLCSLLLGATRVFATASISEEAIKLFGTEEAKGRIAKGALFIDGEFVRAPYSVTREGNVILVNGKVASRLTPKPKSDEPEEVEPEEPEEVETVEEEDSTEGSDEMPTLDESDFATSTSTPKPSEIEKRLASKGGSIDDRLAAKRRRADLKSQSKGGFNTGLDADGKKVAYNPEALFEEADYTYTPPSKPEPKAVPYIRPEAQLSAKERAELAKAREAKRAAIDAEEDAAGAQPETSGDEEIADAETSSDEAFSALSEAEVERYTKALTARRKAIENTLKVDGLVLLSSSSFAVKAEKRPTMWRFMLDLPKHFEESSSDSLCSKWSTTVPRGYLQLIHKHRSENEANMKTILLRIKREAKSAKERSRSRL